MKRILVLGNGFDLAHDLPTKYKDFLDFCKELTNDDNFFNSSDNSKINLIVKKFKSNTNYIEAIKNNLWIDYFLKKGNKIGENWIDFEKEIKYVCDSSLKIKDLNSIKNIDNEISIFRDVKGFNISQMKKDLIGLKSLFNKYLLTIDENNKKFIKSFSPDVYKFFPTDVITFNYTLTFEKNYNYGCNICHVHGKIDQNKNTLVLGYDSYDNKDTDYQYAEFLKYFQMIDNDINLDTLYEVNKGEEVISMFYGHSMDRTDSEVITEIIKKSKKVYIYYYSDSHKAQMIKNLISIYGRAEVSKLCMASERKIFFQKQSKLEDFVMNQKFEYNNLLNHIITKNISNDNYSKEMDSILSLDCYGINLLEDILNHSIELYKNGNINYKILEDYGTKIIDKINDIYDTDVFADKSQKEFNLKDLNRNLKQYLMGV